MLQHSPNNKVIVTHKYLDDNPNIIYVYSDNLLLKGNSYDCIYRNHPQALAFTTYKKPPTLTGDSLAFYCLETEYPQVYQEQVTSLKRILQNYRFNDFVIAPLGKELEPKSYVFEDFITHNIQRDLKDFDNIVYNW